MSAMTLDEPSHTTVGKNALGWRLLVFFWIALLLLALVSAGLLQYLGPVSKNSSGPDHAMADGAVHNLAAATPTGPTSAPSNVSSASPSPTGNQGNPVVVVAPKAPVPASFQRPGSPIAAPVAALLEPVSAADSGSGAVGLPRVVPGLKPPMQAYAGGFDPQDHRPRVAFVLSGFGLSEPDSEDAVRLLPPGITFAVSPYSANPEPLLQLARAKGHEFLASIPMEAQGFPMDDEGSHSLLTGASPKDTIDNLRWSLSRFAGYAGTTGALDGMRGERFAASEVQMKLALDEITGRGLFYVDPRPGQKLAVSGNVCDVDMVVDEPPVHNEIVAKLSALERIAHDTGHAIGLAGTPRPVTIAQLSVWASQLDAHGIVLVPVSSFITSPASASLPAATR